MLADPLGKEFATGPSLLPDQGTVEYLIEVCDPCQEAAYGYAVNGVVLSDFILPTYYKAFGDGRYSFAGNITEPRRVLPGGYVSCATRCRASGRSSWSRKRDRRSAIWERTPRRSTFTFVAISIATPPLI